MKGAGLVAVEGQIPVVPLRLHIHDLGRQRASPYSGGDASRCASESR